MSHEGYIKKKNLTALQANETQMQDTNEEWKAYHNMQDNATALINDQRRQFLTGVKKEDSGLMKAVKDATADITRFYTENTIPEDKNAFEKQLKIVMGLYDTLNKKCKAYLDERRADEGWKRFHIGAGYRRRLMVEKVLTRASDERKLLETRANLVFKEFADVKEAEERPLWVNVLAETRIKYLDFSNLGKDTIIEHTGGNSSTVLKIVNQTKGVNYYIKEEEKNVPAQITAIKYVDEYLQSDFVKQIEKEGTSKRQVGMFLGYLYDCCNESDFIRNKFINTNDIEAVKFLSEKNQAKFKQLILYAVDKKLLPITDEIRAFLDNKYAGRIAGEFAAFYFRSNVAHNLATHSAKIAPNANITIRNIAMQRLAELLGISEIIPATKKVKYKDTAGKEHYGILMAEAKGRPFFEVNQELNEIHNQNTLAVLNNKEPVKKPDFDYDKKVLLQLNSMQVLDILAAQADRHLGNIIVERSGDRIVKACGIDNDMCFGTLTYEQIVYRDEEGENPFSDNFKRIVSPEIGFLFRVLDRRLYENLLALDDNIVTYEFEDLLSAEELNCLLDRIHAVQQEFKKIDPERDDVKICLPDELTEQDAELMKSQQECLTTVVPTDLVERLKRNMH